jgi:D-sedoheptulose 7-phosphate isomerase
VTKAARVYAKEFLAETVQIIAKLDTSAIDRTVRELVALRARGGRLFIVGSGGGAGHASHAVSDFRKLAAIEAYSPADNVSELTARINDDGWVNSYVEWLKVSRLDKDDMLFVISVGGGDEQRNVSRNIVRCIDHARQIGATICGIVGRDGGHTAKIADVVIIIPPLDPSTVTPQTEGLQAVLWHLLVSHPELQASPMRWESLR